MSEIKKAEKRHRNEEPAEGFLEGRNAVMEALRSERGIEKIFVSNGETDHTLKNIIAMARNQKIPVLFCDRRKLDGMSVTKSHQGIIAVASAVSYVSVEDILSVAEKRGEKPFIIICDGITDVHNLGAILRSAEASGAHGVIIPKRRSAGVNAVVGKTSAGASNYIPVCKVPNLNDAVKKLKDAGVWIYGTDMDGDRSIYEASFQDAVALVIGSEGDGMSQLIKKQCDYVVQIPMRGKINSLNASAAASIIMYEVVRQRHYR